MVTGIRVHESGARPQQAVGELILVIEATGPSEVIGHLTSYGNTVAAVIAKCHVDDDADIIQAAAQSSCALLLVDDRVEWMHVISLLQAEIRRHSEAGSRDTHQFAERSVLDLYELADLAADAVGGPVTIKDEAGWLLAYSKIQRGGDRTHRQTLLSRRDPPDFADALEAHGVLQALRMSDVPVVISMEESEASDRLAICLRAGGYVLGAMWAVTTQPSQQQRDDFAEVARRTELQLMRRHAEDYRERRVEIEQLAVLLYPGATPPASGDSLQLLAGRHTVVALSIADSDPGKHALTRSQLEKRLAIARRSNLTFHVGQISNLWYLIVTLTGSLNAADSTTRMQAWLHDILVGPHRDRLNVFAGIGSIVDHQVDLPRSRQEAESALGVARNEGVRGAATAFEDSWAQAALLRLGETALLASLERLSPLRKLAAFDLANGSSYVLTLRAWLDQQGNVRLAAQHLHIHTNTLRYRIAKLTEIARIDLNDADVCLVLSLQLRGPTYAPVAGPIDT